MGAQTDRYYYSAVLFPADSFGGRGILREQYRDDERLGYYFRAYSVCQFCDFHRYGGICPFLYELVCIRREKLMCIAGFALMYVFSYVCAKTDSIFLLALCSLLTGFLRMVLMMVNLFTLIKYAFGMEATRNITPGMEPKDATGWNKLDIEKCVSQPVVYLFL